jgi:hypothetical protein
MCNGNGARAQLCILRIYECTVSNLSACTNGWTTRTALRFINIVVFEERTMAKNRRHAGNPQPQSGLQMSAFSDRQFGLPFYSNTYGPAAQSVSTASVAATAMHRNESTISRLNEVLATHENRPTSLLTLGAVAASPRYRVKQGSAAAGR